MLKRKRAGFTLIELVIVVAIIGILVLIALPQFNRVTEQARIETFNKNCKTVIASIGVFQAAHEGDMPADTGELGTAIEGGWERLVKSPVGASYAYDNGVFTASYTDRSGETHSYQFPQ